MGADRAVVAGGAVQPRKPGRKRVPDRQVLCGILFVLHTGSQWEFLPQELGFGSGMTCWTRLRDWNEAGVWSRLHEALHEAGSGLGPRRRRHLSRAGGPKAGRARTPPHPMGTPRRHPRALLGSPPASSAYRHVRRFRQDRLIRGRRLKVTPTPPGHPNPMRPDNPNDRDDRAVTSAAQRFRRARRPGLLQPGVLSEFPVIAAREPPSPRRPNPRSDVKDRLMRVSAPPRPSTHAEWITAILPPGIPTMGAARSMASGLTGPSAAGRAPRPDPTPAAALGRRESGSAR